MRSQPTDIIRPRMDTRFFLLQLTLVAAVFCDDEPQESDGIHLSDLINQLQGKPYYTYHRVGSERTYYYHGAGDNSNYGSSYFPQQSYYSQPESEGYRQVYHNGAWRWAYLSVCDGQLVDYVNGYPRYYCNCGRLGSHYQLGVCNAEQYWSKTGK